MDDLPELRAHVPALEPDAVLLGQLVELSAASTAAATARPKLRPARALSMGAAALGLVAATSWIAGALPGVPSPMAPDPTPTPTTPVTPSRTGDVTVPGAGIGPTSGASRPHAGAPDVASSASPGWTPPGQPTTRPTGPGEGRDVGRGPEKRPDQGKHHGHHNKHRSKKGTPGLRDKGQPSPPRPSSSRQAVGQRNDPATGP
jgi:hypothetical protein